MGYKIEAGSVRLTLECDSCDREQEFVGESESDCFSRASDEGWEWGLGGHWTERSCKCAKCLMKNGER